MTAVEKICNKCRLHNTCDIKYGLIKEIDFIVSNLDGKVEDSIQAKEAVELAIQTAEKKGCIGNFYQSPGKIIRFDH